MEMTQLHSRPTEEEEEEENGEGGAFTLSNRCHKTADEKDV